VSGVRLEEPKGCGSPHHACRDQMARCRPGSLPAGRATSSHMTRLGRRRKRSLPRPPRAQQTQRLLAGADPGVDVRGKAPTYPFRLRSNRHLRAGQFWAMPLRIRRVACGAAVKERGTNRQVGPSWLATEGWLPSPSGLERSSPAARTSAPPGPKQEPSVRRAVRPLVVPSERLAGTAADARVRGRADAESRMGIPKRACVVLLADVVGRRSDATSVVTLTTMPSARPITAPSAMAAPTLIRASVFRAAAQQRA
jgi:hypothetical protein